MKKERAIQKAKDLSKQNNAEYLVIFDPYEDDVYARENGYFVYGATNYPEYTRDSEIIFSSWE